MNASDQAFGILVFRIVGNLRGTRTNSSSMSALASPVDQWLQEYSHKFLPIEVRVVYYLFA